MHGISAVRGRRQSFYDGIFIHIIKKERSYTFEDSRYYRTWQNGAKFSTKCQRQWISNHWL